MPKAQKPAQDDGWEDAPVAVSADDGWEDAPLPKAPDSSAVPMSNKVQNAIRSVASAPMGVAQGMTLGNVGNIGGAIGAGVGKLADLITGNNSDVKQLESQGFKIQQPSAFDTYKRGTNEELDRAFAENPVQYGAGYLGGNLALAAPAAAATKALGGGVAGAAALGALQGGLQDFDPNDLTGQGYKALGGGIMGGAGGKLGDWLKQKANNSMLRAVGVTGAASKNIPAGTGNRLVGEGLWGTKSGLADQVGSKYAQSEAELQKLAENLPDEVSAGSLADYIKAKAGKFINPETGKTTPGYENASKAFGDVEDAVRSSGKGAIPAQKAIPVLTPTEAIAASGEPIMQSIPGQAIPGVEGRYGGKGLIALKRAGDEEAFNQSGKLGNTYAAEANKAQADAAREALSKLSGGVVNDQLKRQQALLIANKGLRQPEMVAKNPISLSGIAGGLIGSANGGLPGAGTGAALAEGLRLALPQSVLAHGLQRVAAPAASSSSLQRALMQAYDDLKPQKKHK